MRRMAHPECVVLARLHAPTGRIGQRRRGRTLLSPDRKAGPVGWKWRSALIDLHNHLLPGVDDGARTIDVTRRMLDRFAQLGYQTIVATPHLHDRLDPAYRATLGERLDVVAREARATGLTVRGGYEVFLTPDVPRRLAEGETSTLAGTRSILVELPFVGWPAYTETAIFSLQAAGYRPILAHPERYQAVQKDPRLALELARRGVLLQLTLRSLVGSSRQIQRTSAGLLAAGAIALVASDAHGDDHRLAAVPDALRRLADLVGTEHADRIARLNPQAILDDGPIAQPGPIAESDPGGSGPRWWRRRR